VAPAVEPVVARPENPCVPDPCGPYSTCRPESSGRPACTCKPGYFGAPPNCRPECLLSSDCGLSQACVRQACVDPCPGTCGTNAECKVVNHNPICSCPVRFSGDPFINCIKEPEVREDFIKALFPCLLSEYSSSSILPNCTNFEAVPFLV
jgi:hypothetical protein